MILVNTLECVCPNIKIYFEKITIYPIKKDPHKLLFMQVFPPNIIFRFAPIRILRYAECEGTVSRHEY